MAGGWLFLGYVNGSGKWDNAIAGNSLTGSDVSADPAGTQGLNVSWDTFRGLHGGDLANYVGAWGVDTTGGTSTAWAVLNHASDIGVVPEPGTLILLGVGALGLVLPMIRRRKRA